MSSKKNCIIYLVRTSQGDLDMLNRSLALVDSNVLGSVSGKTSIIIFHEKSFDAQYRAKVLPLKHGVVAFYKIEFSLSNYSKEFRSNIPEFYPHPTHGNGPLGWGHPGFSLGYRHMCDFFSGSLYDLPLLRRYEYYLRLDTDSFILTKIPYDIFQWMAKNKCEYAYIEPALQQDHQMVTEGLWPQTETWIETHAIITHVPIKSLPEGRMFYTNFELGKVSSFSQGSDYYNFYKFVRDSGNIFIKRWGDAPIKYIGVNLFFKPSAIRPIYGFVYQHGAVFDLTWRGSPIIKLLQKIKGDVKRRFSGLQKRPS